MSQLGISVMLHQLMGGNTVDPAKYYGRKIIAANVTEDKLDLTFEGGASIAIWDDGQSCCESRYMTCDDDPQSLVGHVLTRIEAKDGPDEEGEYGDLHETCFLEIGTDDGFITVATHNVHNGYYGGFALTITES